MEVRARSPVNRVWVRVATEWKATATANPQRDFPPAPSLPEECKRRGKADATHTPVACRRKRLAGFAASSQPKVAEAAIVLAVDTAVGAVPPSAPNSPQSRSRHLRRPRRLLCPQNVAAGSNAAARQG